MDAKCPGVPAMFRGSIVALITPFRNGGIDEAALQSLVEWQIAQGTHGLVPVGTTGESPTLSHAEHERVVELVIEAAAGRVPVIAGAGSNSTGEAISLARHAKRVGADAILVVTPYYNKPTQEGLFAHFKAIHDAADLPLIIYNIPGRSVVDMSVDTMAALAFLANGGDGCISVTANVSPRQCAAMHEAWQRGDARGALAIHLRLTPLHRALFFETSPAPVKYAVARLGKCAADVRLPLVAPKEATKEAVA